METDRMKTTRSIIMAILGFFSLIAFVEAADFNQSVGGLFMGSSSACVLSHEMTTSPTSTGSNQSFALMNGTVGSDCVPGGSGGNHPPTISVTNSNVQVSEGSQINTALVRSGVTANDLEDGDLTAQIIVNGPTLPLTAQAGQNYVFTFDVQDSQGAPASQRTKTFSVPVNQAPTINVITPTQNIAAGSTITDAMVRSGVTANDAEDGNLTSMIQVSGPTLPLTAVSGQVYVFQFDVTDSGGLPASPRFKTYQTDTVNNAPTISVSPTQISVAPGTQINMAAVRAGVSAMDVEDGNLTSNIVVTGPGLPLTAMNGQEYTFTFNVTDSGGLPASPQTRVFVVQGNQINLISPANGQVGTNRQPLLRWETLYTVPANTTFTWKITPTANCATTTTDLTGSLDAQEYQIPAYYQLAPGTSYYWCVKSDDLGLGYTAPFHFTTQQEQIPVPYLNILPSSSAQNASGQEDIMIYGTNGEAGSRAYVYEVIGSNYQEIGSVLISNNGDFVIPYQIQDNSEAKEFRFVSRIKRGSSFGPYSSVASYFFDPALTVASPELKHTNPAMNGNIRWIPDPEAAQYKVWRRVGEELCNEQNQDCFLGTKPFELIASIDSASAVIEDGHIVFRDPAYRTTPPLGTSYFITAHNADGQSSIRSNSISFQDTNISEFHPDYHSIARPNDGYNIDVLLCDPSHSYLWDNSADMKIIVQYAERDVNENCDSFDFDARAVTVQNIFDSLERRNFPQYGLQSCVLANTHVGRPGRSYCERICLEDISTNRKECSDGQSINTPDDTSAPGFGGITNVIPQEDGFSARVMWDRAIPSASVETIQYEVKYTKETDSAGLPVFSGNSFIVEDVNQTEAVIDGLDTGTKYFYEVNALDSAANRSGVDIYLDRATLDNRPKIHQIYFDQVPNPYRPEQKKLTLSVVDREASAGDRVALKSVQYKRPGDSEWQSFDLSQELIINQAQMNSLFAASSPGETNSTEFVLDSRYHFIKLNSGKIRVVVEDQHGLEGEKVIEVDLLKGASEHANYSASGNAAFGCSANANSQASPWGAVATLLGLIALSYFLRRQRSREV